MDPMPRAWCLSPDPTTVPLARQFVAGLLRSNGWDEERIGAAALLTSELTANAVRHAASTYTLTVDLSQIRLRVDVADASPFPPTVRTAASTADSGRGLALVAALADRWGCEPSADGKSVWFEMVVEAD